MTLEIDVISYRGQPPSAPLHLALEARSATVGRKPENDLVLPDPDRVVSGTHLRIEYQGGQYFLLDQSTNGTYLNHASEPVPKGKPIPLSNGDLIQIGEYQLSVRLADEEAKTMLAPEPQPGIPAEPPPAESVPPPSPFQTETLDPLALIGGAAPPSATPDPSLSAGGGPAPDIASSYDINPGTPGFSPENPFVEGSDSSGPNIPDDFDLLADLNPAEPSQPDHAPIEQQAFSPPEVAPEPAPTPPEPPTEGQHATGQHAPVPGSEAMPEPGLPGTAPAGPAPGEEPGTAPTAPPSPSSATPPPPPVGESATGQHPPSPARPEPSSAPADATASAPAQTAGEQAAPAASDRLLQALLEGLGQTPGRPLSPEEQEALARTLGNLVRLTVDGLIRALAVRNGFKQELRLEMTTIRPVENNPLKFSINAQDALQRMLFLRQQGFMEPEQAIEEAFHDIMAHEMAMVAGLQAALQALLDRFDPKALEEHFREFGALTGALPLLREAKYWDVFKKTYAQVRRDAEEGFMHLFGEAFNRAYEEQVHRLRTQQPSDTGGQP